MKGRLIKNKQKEKNSINIFANEKVSCVTQRIQLPKENLHQRVMEQMPLYHHSMKIVKVHYHQTCKTSKESFCSIRNGGSSKKKYVLMKYGMSGNENTINLKIKNLIPFITYGITYKNTSLILRIKIGSTLQRSTFVTKTPEALKRLIIRNPIHEYLKGILVMRKTVVKIHSPQYFKGILDCKNKALATLRRCWSFCSTTEFCCGVSKHE